MNHLKAWLELHGLGRHHERFVENSIDLEIILDLTEADFAELGLNLGDRKRIVRALQTLVADQQNEKPDAVLKAHAAHPERQNGTAEKLHLTMVFVDLVGSTELSNTLDLEEFRDVIHRYQRFALDVISQHHGHVAQFIGDAVTAYFGYPSAAEDDAVRAVHAGLKICSTIDDHLSVPGRQMQTRVGIATGDMVVEEHAMREGLAFGDTPNLAARIMAATAPGTVAVSDPTKQLLGSVVACEWLGRHKLKGFDKAQGIWRVLDSTEKGLRFRARQHGALLPMVDREEELHLLESRWHAVQQGQSQTVLLSGEAGIGKSRLVEALAENIEAEGGLRLNFQCSPHHQGSAFFPLVYLVKVAAGIRYTDGAAQQSRKLSRLLADWFSGQVFEDAFELFSNLIAVPGEAENNTLAISPEKLKLQLQKVLLQLAKGLSERQPLLLLFEDLHWVDPSTEELIDLLIENLEPHRVMVLCTARPEYKFPRTGFARVTTLTVSRLDDHYASELLRNVLPDQLPSAELELQIIKKSDGVPLFLEELSRMVRHRLMEVEQFSSSGELVALPSTLKDLLRAQLDALVTAREIVPICAAIGRSIYPSILQAVASISFERARSELDYLAEMEILVPRGNEKDRRYAFRHALIQDAAYDLMLKSRARALHKKIAAVMVNDFPDTAVQQPDRLAQHYERAEMAAEARDAWRDAAALSKARSATEETIRQLQYALAQNEKISDKKARLTEEIALRETYNVALNTRAFGSRAVLENLKRLHELLLATNLTPQDAFLALHVQFGALLMQEDSRNALAMCPDFDRIASECGDPTMETLAAHNRGMASFMLGAFSEAIESFDTALLARKNTSLEDILRYHAADVGLVDKAMRCWALAFQEDDPVNARKEIRKALAELNPDAHAFSRCFALNILAAAYQVLGDTPSLLELVTQALDISEAHNFEYWNAWSAIIRGWAIARTGAPAEGIEELRSGLTAYIATGSTQIQPYAKTLLADAYLNSGDPETAQVVLEDMNATQKEGGNAYHARLATRLAISIEAARRRLDPS